MEQSIERKIIKTEKINDDGSKSVWEEYIPPSGFGIKHGKYIKYYPYSTQIWYNNNYFDGKYDGVQEEFYPAGNLYRRETAKNGKQVGKCERWYPDGTRLHVHNYSMDGREKFDGLCEEWFSNGRQKCVAKYSNGIMIDDYTEWFDNGNQCKKFHYNEKGRLEGIQFQYYPNNSLKFLKNCVDGNLNGVVEEYAENGILLSKHNYVHGKKHGNAKRCCPTPPTIYETFSIVEENYDNGVLHGVCKKWHKNRIQSEESNYQNGLKHGPCKEWDENGTTVTETNYQNGNRHGKITKTFNKTITLFSGEYKDGVPHGTWMYYDTNGKLLNAHCYENGQKSGLSIECSSGEVKIYQPNGELMKLN